MVMRSLMLVIACGAALVAPAAAQDAASHTATPIEHLIVVVGENLTFDNLFATYKPAAGQSVANLLSKGIVNADGSPGPNFALAAQRKASVRERYLVTPPIAGSYGTLPEPGTTYAVGQPRWVPDRRFPAEL